MARRITIDGRDGSISIAWKLLLGCDVGRNHLIRVEDLVKLGLAYEAKFERRSLYYQSLCIACQRNVSMCVNAT